MLGLGSILLGGALGGSAIKRGLENMDAMSKPSEYLEDGTPVYTDRFGDMYVNGEKLYQKYYRDQYGNEHWTFVGEKSKKVYIDSYDRKCRISNVYDERDKQRKLEKGYTAYLKHHPQFTQPVTTEMSTGKIIAGLYGKSDGTYWKYYLKADASIPIEYNENAGIKITQEEYDRLNILDGTHSSMDHFRYNYVRVRHNYVPRPKQKIEKEKKEKRVRAYLWEDEDKNKKIDNSYSIFENGIDVNEFDY